MIAMRHGRCVDATTFLRIVRASSAPSSAGCPNNSRSVSMTPRSPSSSSGAHPHGVRGINNRAVVPGEELVTMC
jgi:hypothetical protein